MTPAAAWLESPEGDQWRREHIEPVGDDGAVLAHVLWAREGDRLGGDPFSASGVDPRHDPCGRTP